MSNVPEVVTFYEPATAAEKLGVSASGLRRLAPIYESVFDELPRTGKGQKDKRARLWSSEAVERLTAARSLVEAERYRTIHNALEALRAGLTVDTDELATETPQAASDKATQAALQMLLEEIKTLRLEVRELKKGQTSFVQLEQEEPMMRERADDLNQHGLLVRAAVQIETWLSRLRS